MPARVTADAFIGRRRELAELAAALERARAGRAELVFVAGESGVGKSRLVDHFADHAQAAGARVLWGDCIDLGDNELPYAPIVSALRSLARGGDPVFDALGPARAELARLLPELGAPAELLVEPYAGSAQGRLFELLLALMRGLSSDGPVLLVIDDLHWADRSTRDFMAFLARNLCDQAVLVVAAYRVDELHRRHPLRPLLAELERSDVARRLPVERFTRAELGAQLANILGAEPDGGLLERVWGRSEGNALYAEEILAAEREGDGTLPESLREALMLRVEALGPDTQEVLRWVAAARRVEHDVLQEAAPIGARELRDALREAVAHHVLLTQADGTIAFRHALLREAVHDDLLPGERAELHRRLALVLDARVGEHPCLGLGRAAEIAHHFDAAGDQPAALRAAVRAAEAAERVHAEGETAALYERALELWDRVENAEALAGCDHVELLHRAAHAHTHDHGRSIVLSKQALGELDQQRDPGRAALLLERLGKARWSQGKGEIALQAWDAALDLLPADPPSEERARLLASKAAGLMLWGRYADGLLMADEALEAAGAVGSRFATMHALNTKGICSLATDLEAGLALLREAMDMARTDGEVDQLVRGYINLSDALHLAGRTREAHALLVAGREELRALGRHATWLDLQQAEMAYHLGLWDEADELMPPELGRGRQGMTRVFFEMRRAELELARGDNDSARDRLDLARELVRRSYEPQWHAPIASLTAGLERRERRLDAARAAIREGLDRVTDTGEVEDGARLARILGAAAGVEADAAQQARDLGRHGEEAAAAAAAADYARRTREAAALPFASHIPEARGFALAAEGEAAAAAGRPDPEPWARAAELWEGIERPFRAGRARWMEAEAHLARGDRAAAEAAATAAMAVARELRIGWMADEVAGLARRGRLRLPDGVEPGAAAPAPGAAEAARDPAAELGLTPRERDVLALVAEGATNREIGERLFMAEKTASVHVSRILAKLDVRSRTEAAAVAHRLGLEQGPAAGRLAAAG
ncbi:AAA family ATPase [Baekduia soli]|uniref:AAA family ATPase n=1 Tax=Baekduia soli TaxID=496014 RepID=A0A5B8UBE9_9ACTN|nr:helix-turn-helix transcriptional regulator [Baekduia soli]QEC49951.1 AAA family ATPase [Baekduia soli]